jgi:hypothetical protein
VELGAVELGDPVDLGAVELGEGVSAEPVG